MFLKGREGEGGNWHVQSKKNPTQLSLYTGRLCLTIHQGQNTGEALCTGKHTINCQKLQGAQSVRSARV